MIEKFTNYKPKQKICFVRLRDTVHYDGTNGKQIMDSFFHVTNEFIKKWKNSYDMNTYNFTIESIPTKKQECRSDLKLKHLVESDYIVIFTENEFQYHMKGRISENIMGRSYCRLLNILEEFDKTPDKERNIILVTSDKADTIELFRDRTFNRSNYYVKDSLWTHDFDYQNKSNEYNINFYRIDEGEFKGGIHHLKHLFMMDYWKDKRRTRTRTNKKVDFVYWGTSKKKKVDKSADNFAYQIKDWYNETSGEYDGRYRKDTLIKYRSSVLIKKGVPSNDYRNTLLKKVKRSPLLTSNMIGYFDSFKYDVKFDKSILNVMPEISKGRATICFNWPGQWEHLTSRYNEAVACDVIPLVWNGYDTNNQLVADDFQRIKSKSFEELQEKLIKLRDDDFRLKLLKKIKDKYESETKPIEYYEKEFEKKMLNYLDNSK